VRGRPPSRLKVTGVNAAGQTSKCKMLRVKRVRKVAAHIQVYPYRYVDVGPTFEHFSISDKDNVSDIFVCSYL